MKKITKMVFAAFTLASVLIIGVSCNINVENDNGDGKNDEVVDTIFKDFYNYPKGYVSANGLLEVTNQVAQEVLLFQSSVSPENYVGTVPASSSAKLALPKSEKFYTLVSVAKSAYKKDPIEATQTSNLVYYSEKQAYKVSVSPSDLTGTGTWIFNNHTNYWVEIESVDGTGTKFAVIQPNTMRVKIPVQLNKAYDYKITYKKELKYNDKIVAIADSSIKEQNDTIFLTNDFKETVTDLSGTSTLADDLAPSILLINNTSKALRVYNGQKQLSNIGVDVEDFVLMAGTTTMVTNLVAGSTFASLNVRSNAWNEAKYCKDSTIMEKGKVYVVSVTQEKEDNTNVKFIVTEKPAIDYYEE